MDSYQIVWLIILTPVFFIYGLVEIRRGWKIIKYNEDSYNLAIQIRLWFMNHLVSEETFRNHKKYLELDKDYMSRRGYYSLIGGIVSLLVSAMWIMVLSINLK